MYTKFPLNTLLRRTKSKVLLTQGSARKVYDLGDGHVLKVAKNKRGIQECSNEFFICCNILKKYKKFLCPVIQHEEKYIIMPKIETYNLLIVNKEIPRSSFEVGLLEREDIKEFIKFLVDTYDIDDYDLTYSFNWGIFDNEPVILDYGHLYVERFLEPF